VLLAELPATVCVPSSVKLWVHAAPGVTMAGRVMPSDSVVSNCAVTPPDWIMLLRPSAGASAVSVPSSHFHSPVRVTPAS